MKGFTKLDNKYLFSNDLGVYSKLVLMGLTYFTRNGTGKCFCKKTTLANYLDLSLYQVRCGLVELEELEVINIRRVGQGNPDIITLKGLKSRNEKISISFKEREEEKNKEEDVLENDVDIEDNTNNQPPAEPSPPPQTFTEVLLDHIPIDRPGNHTEDTTTLLSSLQDVLRPQSYQTWFSQARVVSKDDTEITIGFPLPDTELGWIKDNYVDLLSKVTNQSVQVVKLKGGTDGRSQKESH